MKKRFSEQQLIGFLHLCMGVLRNRNFECYGSHTQDLACAPTRELLQQPLSTYKESAGQRA